VNSGDDFSAPGPACWATAAESTGGVCMQSTAQPERGSGWAALRAFFARSESAISVLLISLFTCCVSKLALWQAWREGTNRQSLLKKHKRDKALQGSAELALLVWSFLLRANSQVYVM